MSKSVIISITKVMFYYKTKSNTPPKQRTVTNSNKLTYTDLAKFREFKKEQNYTKSNAHNDFRNAFNDLASNNRMKPLIKVWLKYSIINRVLTLWEKSSFISIISFPLFCYIGFTDPNTKGFREWWLHWHNADGHWYWWIESNPVHEAYVYDFDRLVSTEYEEFNYRYPNKKNQKDFEILSPFWHEMNNAKKHQIDRKRFIMRRMALPRFGKKDGLARVGKWSHQREVVAPGGSKAFRPDNLRVGGERENLPLKQQRFPAMVTWEHSYFFKHERRVEYFFNEYVHKRSMDKSRNEFHRALHMGLGHVTDSRLLEIPTNDPSAAGSYEKLKKWDLDQLRTAQSRHNGELSRFRPFLRADDRHLRPDYGIYYWNRFIKYGTDLTVTLKQNHELYMLGSWKYTNRHFFYPHILNRLSWHVCEDKIYSKIKRTKKVVWKKYWTGSLENCGDPKLVGFIRNIRYKQMRQLKVVKRALDVREWSVSTEGLFPKWKSVLYNPPTRAFEARERRRHPSKVPYFYYRDNRKKLKHYRKFLRETVERNTFKSTIRKTRNWTGHMKQSIRDESGMHWAYVQKDPLTGVLGRWSELENTIQTFSIYEFYYNCLVGQDLNPYYSFVIQFAYSQQNMAYLQDTWVRMLNLSSSAAIYPAIIILAYWCSSNIGHYTTFYAISEKFNYEHDKQTPSRFLSPKLGRMANIFSGLLHTFPHSSILLFYFIPDITYNLTYTYPIGWLNRSWLFIWSGIQIKGLYFDNQYVWLWMFFYTCWIIPGPLNVIIEATIGRFSELLMQFELWGDEKTHELGQHLSRTQFDSREAGMKLFDKEFILYPRFERWGGHYMYHENVRIMPYPCGPIPENKKGWEWNGGFDKGNYRSVKRQVANAWYLSWSIKNNPKFSWKPSPKHGKNCNIYYLRTEDPLNIKLVGYFYTLETRPWDGNILIMRRGKEFVRPWQSVTERYPDIADTRVELDRYMDAERRWKRYQDVLPIGDLDLGDLTQPIARAIVRVLPIPFAMAGGWWVFFSSHLNANSGEELTGASWGGYRFGNWGNATEELLFRGTITNDDVEWVMGDTLRRFRMNPTRACPCNHNEWMLQNPIFESQPLSIREGWIRMWMYRQWCRQIAVVNGVRKYEFFKAWGFSSRIRGGNVSHQHITDFVWEHSQAFYTLDYRFFIAFLAVIFGFVIPILLQPHGRVEDEDQSWIRLMLSMGYEDSAQRHYIKYPQKSFWPILFNMTNNTYPYNIGLSWGIFLINFLYLSFFPLGLVLIADPVYSLVIPGILYVIFRSYLSVQWLTRRGFCDLCDLWDWKIIRNKLSDRSALIFVSLNYFLGLIWCFFLIVASYHAAEDTYYVFSIVCIVFPFIFYSVYLIQESYLGIYDRPHAHSINFIGIPLKDKCLTSVVYTVDEPDASYWKDHRFYDPNLDFRQFSPKVRYVAKIDQSFEKVYAEFYFNGMGYIDGGESTEFKPQEYIRYGLYSDFVTSNLAVDVNTFNTNKEIKSISNEFWNLQRLKSDPYFIKESALGKRAWRAKLREEGRVFGSHLLFRKLWSSPDPRVRWTGVSTTAFDQSEYKHVVGSMIDRNMSVLEGSYEETLLHIAWLYELQKRQIIMKGRREFHGDKEVNNKIALGYLYMNMRNLTAFRAWDNDLDTNWEFGKLRYLWALQRFRRQLIGQRLEQDSAVRKKVKREGFEPIQKILIIRDSIERTRRLSEIIPTIIEDGIGIVDRKLTSSFMCMDYLRSRERKKLVEAMGLDLEWYDNLSKKQRERFDLDNLEIQLTKAEAENVILWDSHVIYTDFRTWYYQGIPWYYWALAWLRFPQRYQAYIGDYNPSEEDIDGTQNLEFSGWEQWYDLFLLDSMSFGVRASYWCENFNFSDEFVRGERIPYIHEPSFRFDVEKEDSDLQETFNMNEIDMETRRRFEMIQLTGAFELQFLYSMECNLFISYLISDRTWEYYEIPRILIYDAEVNHRDMNHLFQTFRVLEADVDEDMSDMYQTWLGTLYWLNEDEKHEFSHLLRDTKLGAPLRKRTYRLWSVYSENHNFVFTVTPFLGRVTREFDVWGNIHWIKDEELAFRYKYDNERHRLDFSPVVPIKPSIVRGIFIRREKGAGKFTKPKADVTPPKTVRQFGKNSKRFSFFKKNKPKPKRKFKYYSYKLEKRKRSRILFTWRAYTKKLRLSLKFMKLKRKYNYYWRKRKIRKYLRLYWNFSYHVKRAILASLRYRSIFRKKKKIILRSKDDFKNKINFKKIIIKAFLFRKVTQVSKYVRKVVAKSGHKISNFFFNYELKLGTLCNRLHLSWRQTRAHSWVRRGFLFINRVRQKFSAVITKVGDLINLGIPAKKWRKVYIHLNAMKKFHLKRYRSLNYIEINWKAVGGILFIIPISGQNLRLRIKRKKKKWFKIHVFSFLVKNFV
jgi:hypothetical protein